MDATTPPDHDPIEQARHLLDSEALGLDALAARVGLGPHALRRRFIERYGLSPSAYLAQHRLGRFKRQLRGGGDVTRAIYEAGYGSPSRVYEHGAARIGMTPARYARGGAGESIHWTTLPCRLGLALVAATERGVCAVLLGEDEATLAGQLRAEFPAAALSRCDDGRNAFLAPRIEGVAAALAGRHGPRVPVELVGTAFQHRVWQALMGIPPGQRRSYAEVAARIDAPRAVRAVASACANNRVAVLVPCHRVVRGDGSLAGYRWGLPLKQRLLADEVAEG